MSNHPGRPGRSTISWRWAASLGLDHAPVFRDWKLPACFAEVRAELERIHGAMGGSRRFVRVLQLLGEHPMARVTQAIEACLRDHLHSAEAVIQRTRSLAAIEATKRDAAVPAECPPRLVSTSRSPTSAASISF